MPNFGLVINSTYNPMSFEQYAAPFEKYAQVYNQMADTYDALEVEANQWEKLANEQDKSSNAYKTYQKYAADIRAAANDLAENGLSTKTRSSISELKRRYASEIKPIEELYNYRNKLAEEQRKLNPKGDMQWDVDFSNIGLDALAANPTMTYKGRSLAEVEKAGEDIARAASSRRHLSEEAQDMANQYYRVSQGFDGGDVADFLAKNVNNPAFQELMGLYEQVRTTYGTNNPESIYSQDQNAIADERILTGMLKGLAYKEDYQTNYKVKTTNTKSGSGSGDDIITQYVGYETTIEDDKGVPHTYTTINEGGKKKYYDSNNKEVTDAKIIETLNKSKSEGRYYLQPHNNNADLVTVMDMKTGMPLVQDGKYIEFNRKTHYWDSVNKQLKKIEEDKKATSKTIQYSTKKIYGHGNDGVSQYFDNLEDANSSITKLTSRPSETSEISDLIRLADEYGSYTNDEKEKIEALLDKKDKELTDVEKDILADYKSKERAYNIVKKQGLSSEALNNPEGFTIQYTKEPYRKGRYSFIIIPKQSYSINDSGELVENQEFDPNKH